MKLFYCLFFPFFLLAVTLGAASNLDDSRLDQYSVEQSLQSPEVPRPKIDPLKIINASNAFLKEREPEMTSEELALYDRVVSMLSTNPALAVRLLEGMLAGKSKASPAFQFILGNAYYSSGDYARSEALYKNALDQFPSFLRALNNLGVLYYATERYGDAIAAFSKSLSLGDHSAATIGLLAYSLEKSGDPISAEASYLQAISLEPTNSDWKEGLLRVYTEQKKFGPAESLAHVLSQAHPENRDYRLTRANLLISEQRKVDAMVVLETAVDQNAASQDATLLLGDLYAEQNLTNEALRTYQRVLASSGDIGVKRLLRLAAALTASGKLDDADRALEKVNPPLSEEMQVEFARGKANLLLAKKEFPAAREQYRALLKLKPFDGSALLAIARTYSFENNLSEATVAFEAAATVNESAYAANLELANLALKVRHYREGIGYLEKALALQRTEVVEDYLSRIKPLAESSK